MIPPEILQKFNDLAIEQKYVQNMQGEFWEMKNAGAMGVQEALDALPSTGGIAYLPNRQDDYFISKTIHIEANKVLDCNWATIRPSSDMDMFKIKRGGKIKNITVNTSGITYTSSVFAPDGTTQTQGWRVTKWLEGARIVGNLGAGTGKAINMVATAPAAGNQYIQLMSAEDIVIYGYEFGIRLYVNTAAGTGAWVNGNSFSNILIFDSVYPIDEDSTGHNADYLPAGNIYTNARIEKNANTDTIYFGSAATFIGNIFDSPNLTFRGAKNKIISHIGSGTLTDSGSNNTIISETSIIGGDKIIHWLSTTVLKTGGTDYTVDGTWTDLDLTSATSAKAKFIIMNLVHKNTCSANDGLLVRKNGETPSQYPFVKAQVNGQGVVGFVICACDSGQVIEYYATDASDTDLQILGYIE